MSLMTLQILKLVDSPKTQKCKYCGTKSFFLQIKKIIRHKLRATLRQKNTFWKNNKKVLDSKVKSAAKNFFAKL